MIWMINDEMKTQIHTSSTDKAASIISIYLITMDHLTSKTFSMKDRTKEGREDALIVVIVVMFLQLIQTSLIYSVGFVLGLFFVF